MHDPLPPVIAFAPMATSERRRVLVIHTGGTMGMWRNAEGTFEPRRGHLSELIQSMPELASASPPIPEFDLLELDELLDSSAMTPLDWYRIARRIAFGYDDYHGFVVLHGTDTLSFTASALSFLLRGLDRPVILTGSQIPLQEPRNDAREHLLTSLILAARPDVPPEVCVYFHGELLRGNRTTKVDADGYDAFESPNYPPLGRVGVRIELGPGSPWRPALVPPDLDLGDAGMSALPIGTFRIYPGVDPSVIGRMIPEGEKGFGLVLETFGAGNGPEQGLRPVLERAIAEGVVVVNVTQCLRGTVNPKLYAAGSWMQAIGVTSGLDLTPEAAVAKLYWLLRRFPRRHQADAIRAWMPRNLRGELTATPSTESPV